MSSTSSITSSSKWWSTNSANLSSPAWRSNGVNFLHEPEKARLEDLTATSMSAASPSATWVINSRVAGFLVSKVRPEIELRNLPSIRIWFRKALVSNPVAVVVEAVNLCAPAYKRSEVSEVLELLLPLINAKAMPEDTISAADLSVRFDL